MWRVEGNHKNSRIILRDNMKKQVVRFDFWINPVFDQHLKGVADIDLTVCR